MPPRPIHAAGGVLYRDGYPDSGPEFLVVHRNRYHDWSLPKGKLDRGESFEDGAVREIKEETGYKSKKVDYLGAVTYETNRSRLKLVRYWLAKAQKGSFKPNSEVDNIEWVGLHGAQALLTYNRDARLVERAHAILRNPTSTRLYLVRHGNAGIRSKWQGADKKRPLTENGQQQSLGIAEILARHPITEIWSSPTVRSIETLAPVADNLGTVVQTTKLLKEFTELDVIYDYLSSLGPGSIVLGTHKDWIGPLLKDLSSRGVKLRGTRKWPKASVWILDLVDGKVVSGFYEGRG
jgi:8-oxo-dGTP pyrophosphatase MutT (NUDIX family)/phosphohistidine phosphatase SixA